VTTTSRIPTDPWPLLDTEPGSRARAADRRRRSVRCHAGACELPASGIRPAAGVFPYAHERWRLSLEMQCRHCGQDFSEERARLGYDYCTEPSCVGACLKRLNVVAVHVNKASDQYVLREHLDLPDHKSTRSLDPGWTPLLATSAGAQRAVTRNKTTVAAINELEAELDEALAVETDPRQRNKLVNDYNAKLRRFDIRYRRLRQRQRD
jgi:hypothetical protein